MLREFTCIMCPQGCDISVELDGTTITGITGNKCAKGEAYVTQEIENPMRNIATSACRTSSPRTASSTSWPRFAAWSCPPPCMRATW